MFPLFKRLEVIFFFEFQPPAPYILLDLFIKEPCLVAAQIIFNRSWLISILKYIRIISQTSVTLTYQQLTSASLISKEYFWLTFQNALLGFIRDSKYIYLFIFLPNIFWYSPFVGNWALLIVPSLLDQVCQNQDRDLVLHFYDFSYYNAILSFIHIIMSIFDNVVSIYSLKSKILFKIYWKIFYWGMEWYYNV